MTLRVEIRHSLPGLDLDVQFEAPPGITVLFGPSGSGKTSIIRAVSGLFKAEHSEILLDGKILSDARQHLPPHKRGLGYIFQDHRLFPHLNVRQNLRFGARFSAGGVALEEARVIELLGIGALLDRRPGALSGGEAARVAIGRALLARPRMILADEPLASLDMGRKAEILPYFERLRDEFDIPILYVTHAIGEVARLATTIVVLSEGKVVRTGPALDVLSDPMVTPSGPRAAGAVIKAVVVAHHDDGLSALDAGGVTLFLPKVAALPGTHVRVRIAAQDVILADRPPEGLSALNILPGKITSIRTGDGPGAIVSLDTASGALLARVTQRSVGELGLCPGKQIWAVIKTVSVAPEDIGA